MGFMDKVKKATSDLTQQAQDKVNLSIEKAQQNHENAQLQKQEQKELKATFNATNTMGDISIDSHNRLFKIKHASANIKKKTGFIKGGAKATAAMMTLGASVALEQAMKPSDKVFSFDELRSFELLEDDSQVVGGGVGMALVGGAFFGVGGAIAGAMTGGKKTKKTVENLVLKINLNDMDFPCVMITYLNKSTKVSSNAYRDALSSAQETISCLKLILEQVSPEKPDQTVAVNVTQATVSPIDPVEEIKKHKELLDMGIITQEEFDQKKRELLGL